MRLRHRAAAVCALLLGAGCATSTGRPSDDDSSPGRHILLVDADRTRFERAVESVGGRLESFHGPTGVATVIGLEAAAAAELARRGDVLAMGPDANARLLPHGGPAERTVALTDTLNVRGDPVDAPHLGRQWHLSAMGADQAWAAGYRGSSEVTVAILDTGIDAMHPDLRGRVDLARSVSFVPRDDALVEELFAGRHPVTDLHYHGTHVAATVASNAVAAAGVTSETTLIGVKVLGENGEGPLSGIVRGILHAVDAGADVINLSLGGQWRRTGLDWYLGVVHVVLSHARDRGVTVVASSGNEGRDLDADPGLFDLFCESPLVVCVSATGPTASAGDFGPYEEVDALAPYSNHGSAVDVAAPGGAAEPVWAACSSSSLHLDCAKEGTVVGLSGTSMAAPHVSGLAALLVDAHGRDPDRLRTLVERFAVDRGQPGWDGGYGWGRVDAARSLGLHVPGSVEIPGP